MDRCRMPWGERDHDRIHAALADPPGLRALVQSAIYWLLACPAEDRIIRQALDPPRPEFRVVDAGAAVHLLENMESRPPFLRDFPREYR